MGMLFDTKFDLKMKTQRAINRKFALSKSGTNGYLVAQFKDPFKRTIAMALMALFKLHRTSYMLAIAMALMALFKLHRTSYMSAHQVAFVESIVHERRANWAGIFH
ncbi:hypothetical protein R1flu_026614 [Riccia fluitans]|uniref:Uncharacterized protein n=1 Tax=Riccia fluitans TaxID=41844 RepID=A0ABD1XJD0_9MARC